MPSTLCVLTIFNVVVQCSSIILNFVYVLWASFSDWFNINNKDDVQKLKKVVENLELYTNTVEYTAMAMLPLQITLIVLLKCCSSDCAKCKKNLEDDEFNVDKYASKMNIKKSEFVL